VKATALLVIASLLAATPLAGAGCTPAQAANVISTIESYLQYVSTFVSVAEGIWQVLSPLLGTNAPAANVQFNTAVQALNDATVAMEDGLAAAQAANTPAPDFATLITNCQAAVNQIVNIIALYSKPAPTSATGADLTTLSHMQSVIRGWK
jgi:hypothetical protein